MQNINAVVPEVQGMQLGKTLQLQQHLPTAAAAHIMQAACS
jgi:hypothetical protein